MIRMIHDTKIRKISFTRFSEKSRHIEIAPEVWFARSAGCQDGTNVELMRLI